MCVSDITCETSRRVGPAAVDFPAIHNSVRAAPLHLALTACPTFPRVPPHHSPTQLQDTDAFAKCAGPDYRPNNITEDFYAHLDTVLRDVTQWPPGQVVFDEFCALRVGQPEQGTIRISFRVTLHHQQGSPLDIAEVERRLMELFKSEEDNSFQEKLEQILDIVVVLDKDSFSFSLLGAALGFLENLDWWQVRQS